MLALGEIGIKPSEGCSRSADNGPKAVQQYAVVYCIKGDA